MSLRDPLKWFKHHRPGESHDTIRLFIKHGVGGLIEHPAGVYTKERLQSYNTMVEWLEKSTIHIWPYAEASCEMGAQRDITIVLKIDAAECSDDVIARTVAKTLTALSDHVAHQTRFAISIDTRNGDTPNE